MVGQNPPAIIEAQGEKPDLLAQMIADAQAHAAEGAKAPDAPKVPEKSKDTKFQNVARALVMALGAGMDIDSTNKAMKVPGMSEQNSWLYGKHPSLGRLIGTKIAVNAPLMWAAHKIAQKNGPVEGMMPVVFPAAVQGIAGGMNYSKIAQQKKNNREDQ